MISASEAKNKTQNVRDNYEKDLKKIEDRINIAISRGEFSIVIDAYVCDLVIEKLENFGYIVKLHEEETRCGRCEFGDLIHSRYPLILHTNTPFYTIEWS